MSWAGWYTEDKYGVLYRCSYNFLGEFTNNNAKCSTFISGLTVAKQENSWNESNSWGNKKLVVSKGEWRVKDKHLRALRQ